MTTSRHHEGDVSALFSLDRRDLDLPAQGATHAKRKVRRAQTMTSETISPAQEFELQVQRLVTDIKDSRPDGGMVRIFCGEGEPYNHPEFPEAVQDAYESGVLIRVISGPILLVTDDTLFNGLIDLASRERLQLRHRSSRGSTHHFRVIDAKDGGYRFHAERPHPVLPDIHHGLLIPEQEIDFAVKSAISLFDDWFTRLSSLPPIKPLTLTRREIRALVDRAKQKSRDIDYLTVDQLAKLHTAAV